VRAIVERWGGVAARPEPAATAATEPKTPAQSPDASAEEPETTPVDMDRLLDFTDGNPENLRELATLYLSQTSEQLEQLQAAVAAAKPKEVRRLAHSCAGASATCGMRRIVPLLRELERQGYEEQLTNAAELCPQLDQEFQRIRAFLEAHLASLPALAPQPES